MPCGRFPYVEEAHRLVLPLARVKSKLAPAYADLETALEKALALSITPIKPQSAPQVCCMKTAPSL